MAKFAKGDAVQIRVPEDFLYNGCSATIKEVVRENPGVYKVDLDVGRGFIVGENRIVPLGTPGGIYTYRIEKG